MRVALLMGIFCLMGQTSYSQIGVDAQFGGTLSNEPNSIRGVYKEFEISPKPKESHWLSPMFIVPATLSLMPGDNTAQNYYLGVGAGIQFIKWNPVRIDAGFGLNHLLCSTDEGLPSEQLSGYSRMFESFKRFTAANQMNVYGVTLLRLRRLRFTMASVNKADNITMVPM